jgi:hypothetical protein
MITRVMAESAGREPPRRPQHRPGSPASTGYGPPTAVSAPASTHHVGRVVIRLTDLAAAAELDDHRGRPSARAGRRARQLEAPPSADAGVPEHALAGLDGATAVPSSKAVAARACDLREATRGAALVANRRAVDGRRSISAPPLALLTSACACSSPRVGGPGIAVKSLNRERSGRPAAGGFPTAISAGSPHTISSQLYRVLPNPASLGAGSYVPR